MAARKGQPNIGNDPGFKEGWEQRVKENALGRKRKSFTIRTSWDFVTLVNKAARMRGMTSSAYARRAVAAFIANDLQMPFEDVCKTMPPVQALHINLLRKASPPDNGQGYGEWEVKS